MASQSSKRVLITGAEGYLGSVIALFLIEQGYEVTGLDTGFFKDATLYDVPKYPVLRKDARDFSREDLENIDVVLYLSMTHSEVSHRKNYMTRLASTRVLSRSSAKKAVSGLFLPQAVQFTVSPGMKSLMRILR